MPTASVVPLGGGPGPDEGFSPVKQPVVVSYAVSSDPSSSSSASDPLDDDGDDDIEDFMLSSPHEHDHLLPMHDVPQSVACATRRRLSDSSQDFSDDDRGVLSHLYRTVSIGGSLAAQKSAQVLSSTAHQLATSLVVSSSKQHHHYHNLRGKSVDSFQFRSRSSSHAGARLKLHEMRAQYLIGNTKSPYDWASMIVDDKTLSRMPRRIRNFYRSQNELAERYMEVDSLLDSDISHTMIHDYTDGVSAASRRTAVPANIDEEGQTHLNTDAREEYSGIVTLAIIVNFLINIFLLAGKGAIVILTNSISVIASLVDSALDFLCTTIIWLSTSMAESTDSTTRFNYPVGRSRLEPIGVLVFSVIIIVSFCQVAVEAIERLYSGPRVPVRLGLPSFAIMSMAVILKLFAWLWCRSINSSAVQALAQDAMSDIVFNILSMLFPIAGHLFGYWWLDPLGALLLSIYIIHQWVETTLEHIRNLSGVAGDSVDKQVVTYLCLRFAESIKQVTAVNVYHSGDRLQVEVDIVVEDQLSLRDTHDLGEALQYAIETLPMVERAYVHLDYRGDNFVGHIQR
ncbi:cation efflux family-domain-containing protein [Myxozyma melibiosi]|uniref:Cation efflux family-domain-containing protein n=2 Tax=Myxozyma melibiosi TaxID=54550 RepID=A0ABR1EXM5_9ASCO